MSKEAEEFTEQYFKIHSNIKLLRMELVGNDFWYQVMQAYADEWKEKAIKLIEGEKWMNEFVLTDEDIAYNKGLDKAIETLKQIDHE